MNEPYIRDKGIQRREVPKTRRAMQLRCPSEERVGFSPHYGGIRGNGGGHSPVGGDSLLVTQAGGGSCTRRGELKFRRKEED